MPLRQKLKKVKIEEFQCWCEKNVCKNVHGKAI